MQEVGSIQAETDITENLVSKINAAINVKQDELRKATLADHVLQEVTKMIKNG